MEIRRLTKDDFYALRQLLDRVFSDHNGREVSFARTFPRLFGEENGFAPESHLGAFVDGKLVGTAAMYPLPYVVGGRPIRLIANGNVAVDAAYRGQGIMSALLEAVNRECDRCGDLCYLHGNAVRYGRFGYVAAGIQYRLTVEQGAPGGYTFRLMEQRDVPTLNALSRQKTDYILREDRELIPALRSGGREAMAVLDEAGELAGYLSLQQEKGHVEEYALLGPWEAQVFSSLAAALQKPVTVTISGYDPAAAERCKEIGQLKEMHPALCRIPNPEALREAAKALGLDESVLYAPYLT
jgi:predicted N-acetyltransferase YhbS